MDYVEYVRRKVDSTLAQLHAIECGDFPYGDPKRALTALRAALDERLNELNHAVDGQDEDEISSLCKDINYKIVELHPILGFLLRATNIRNQFEIFSPIRDLAHQLLEHTPDIILSSEWNFSPFTYPFVSEDLRSVVFIGLPASEAGNALVLPLAGHELGHSIWRRGGVGQQSIEEINHAVAERFLADDGELKDVFGPFASLEDLLDDQTVVDAWSLSCDVAARQCEGSFCDAIGVRLFGEAFLHSFEYLLIPSLGGDRSELYPSLDRRVSDMKSAAALFQYDLRSEHSFPTLESRRTLPKRDEFVVRVADDAATGLVMSVLSKAGTYCADRDAPVVDMGIADTIAKDFARYFPGQATRYLGNIVNAGWLVYKSFPSFAFEIKDRDQAYDILNNLIFKSLEVLEYETKVPA